jgi:hypothetical protein
MSQGKKTTRSGGANDGYTVGYGKPPQHSRFQPGKSGNPVGRPKGLRNFKTEVQRMLKQPVKINDGGRSRDASTQEAALMRLREKALKGDSRGLDRVVELADRYNNDEANGAIAQELSPDDREILDAYTAKVLAGGRTPNTHDPPRRERVKIHRPPKSEPSAPPRTKRIKLHRRLKSPPREREALE